MQERYPTSSPVSSDWYTEEAHERDGVADESGVSEEDAQAIMIELIGFSTQE